MSIHSDHPFATPDGLRDPLRRLRGRLAQPVSVWTTGELDHPEGWTLSSMLIADGDPPEVIGLLDPDSELADVLAETGTSTVSINLLASDQAPVAEAFARLAPSPGGVFRTGEWVDAEHGPLLRGAAGWLGVRLHSTAPTTTAPTTTDPTTAGWGLLVRGTVELAEVGPGEPLYHLRGEYRS